MRSFCLSDLGTLDSEMASDVFQLGFNFVKDRPLLPSGPSRLAPVAAKHARDALSPTQHRLWLDPEPRLGTATPKIERVSPSRLRRYSLRVRGVSQCAPISTPAHLYLGFPPWSVRGDLKADGP